MRIFLVGFMGAGKTTNGRKLANYLNLDFIDLDSYIEQKHKASISFIFDLLGEEGFRFIEHRAILEILQGDNYVLSSGGGSPCFFDNMKMFYDSGITVYLKMPPQSLWYRLINAKKKRPLIRNLSKDELLAYIEKELQWREKFYKQAHITVDAHSLDIKQLSEQIINLAKK